MQQAVYVYMHVRLTTIFDFSSLVDLLIKTYNFIFKPRFVLSLNILYFQEDFLKNLKVLNFAQISPKSLNIPNFSLSMFCCRIFPFPQNIQFALIFEEVLRSWFKPANSDCRLLLHILYIHMWIIIYKLVKKFICFL